jgi:plastocyanin domain-containing protein
MSTTTIVTVIAGALIGGFFLFSAVPPSQTAGTGTPKNSNVSLTGEGAQLVTIDAKGGYSPRITELKSDTPTLLQVRTKGTFDCSTALMIPSIGYQDYLPPSGTTEIEIPPQKSGSSIKGLCSMAMYSFTLRFI